MGRFSGTNRCICRSDLGGNQLRLLRVGARCRGIKIENMAVRFSIFIDFGKGLDFLPVLLYKLMLSRYFTQDRKLIASRRECELIINHRYSIIAK